MAQRSNVILNAVPCAGFGKAGLPIKIVENQKKALDIASDNGYYVN